MIIFGWRGVTYSKDKGEFYCPSCQESNEYKLKRVRNFFTLYFIPVIPLQKLGEYVECRKCKDAFRPEIVDFDPEEVAKSFEAQYFVAVRRVMVEMMLADGVIDDNEKTMIAQVYFDMTGKQLDPQQLTEEIGQAQRESAGISALQHLGPTLNGEGKETVLFAAYRVAAADGHIADEEWALLAEAGEALGMSAAHINGVIAEAESRYPLNS